MLNNFSLWFTVIYLKHICILRRSAIYITTVKLQICFQILLFFFPNCYGVFIQLKIDQGSHWFYFPLWYNAFFFFSCLQFSLFIIFFLWPFWCGERSHSSSCISAADGSLILSRDHSLFAFVWITSPFFKHRTYI